MPGMNFPPESRSALTEQEIEEKEHLLWLIRKCQPSVNLLARVFVEYVGDDGVSDAVLAIWQQALLARGQTASKDLAESYAPYLSAAEFAARLGVSEGEVREMTARGEVLAVTFRSAEGSFYPEFLLDGNSVRSWVPKLLKALPIEPWAILMFLSRKPDDLAGRSRLDYMLEGAPDAERVLLEGVESYLS